MATSKTKEQLYTEMSALLVPYYNKPLSIDTLARMMVDVFYELLNEQDTNVVIDPELLPTA